MLSHPAQTMLAGQAFRPFDEGRRVTSWNEAPHTDALPSFMQAARDLLSLRERTKRQTRLIEQLAA